MAYRVVKPPIELEFQLCCTIELCSIRIWPKIDSLKSTGFEIYATGDGAQCEFRKVASHFNLQENCIHFINDSIISVKNDGRDLAVTPFYSSARNQLRKIHTIKIIIKQTAKCVPVLKRIEIWGRLSRFTSKEQRAKVHEAIMRVNASLKTKPAKHDELNSTVGPEDSPDNDKADDLAIPEPFLDAITYEIMALPMVLPSGKLIDSSTLLKHAEQEEKWGRVPSDPFTGRPYTDTRKPVLDTHLKSQIDSFLLKNCDIAEIKNAARTVGPVSKRQRLDTMYECETMKFKSMRTELPMNGKKIGTLATTSLKSSTSTSTTATSATMKPKTQSLDDAIREVLKVGKYTATSCTSRPNDIHQCFQCCESVLNLLYKLSTCSHLICRNCLVDKNLSLCKCGKLFSNVDVKKYH